MKKITATQVGPAFLLLILTACSQTEDHLVWIKTTDPPTVVTYAPKEVTTVTASLSGRIESAGGGEITESGIEIYKSGAVRLPDPAARPFSEERYSDNLSEGDYSIFLHDLAPNSTYHYRAFATNSAGTSYGDMMTVVTSYGTVNDAEGNQYQTILIGTQLWMRENLRSRNYPDNSAVKGYFELPTDGQLGKHYTWSAANRVSSGEYRTVNEGICPVGWHIPSDEEWKQMLTFIGIPPDQLGKTGPEGYDQARALKQAGLDLWPDPEVDNSTGFSVLPAGIITVNTDKPPERTAFWTSTPFIYYGFQDQSEKITRGNDANGNLGLSVRCIKDGQ